MIYTTHYDSPIGKILLATKNEQLIGLWFEDQKYCPPFFKEEVKEENTKYYPKLRSGWIGILIKEFL